MGHMQGLASLHLDQILFRGLAAANIRYEAFSKTQADHRIASGTKVNTKDVFYFLEKWKNPESGEDFTIDELVAEASLLVLGAFVEDFGLKSLINVNRHRRHVYCNRQYNLLSPSKSPLPRQINAETRTAFADAEKIRCGVRLNNCRYLCACIDEALRMTPGVSGILPREVLPGGMTIDGRYFPPGVDVGVPIYALQHNSADHSRPFEYIPERRLVDDQIEAPGLGSAEAVALAKSAFCPFSVGPRGCVGKGMAYKGLMIVVARLVYLFDMRIAEGTTAGEGDPSLGEESLRHRMGKFQGLDKFVLQASGPMVELQLRYAVK